MWPATLLMAKLSWLLLLFGGFGPALHGPVIGGVGLISAIPFGMTLLSAAFWAGGACLLLNRAVHGACVAVATTVLIAPFEVLTAWQPHAWVCGGVLLMAALQKPGGAPRFVRWFLVFVHAAVALGALTGAGWIGTALAEPWEDPDFLGALPRWMATFISTDTLSRILYWGTVVVATVIPAGLVVARTQRVAAMLAVVFHTLLYLALGSTEVLLFGGALVVAQVSCLTWPRTIVVVWPRACGWPLFLRIVLDRYDFELRTDWPRPPDPDAELEAQFDRHHAAGARVIVNLLLCFPVFYFVLLATIAATHASLPRVVAVPLISGIALALVGFRAYVTLSRVPTRKAPRPRPTAPAPQDSAAVLEATPGDSSDVTTETDIPPPPDR